MTLSTIPGVQLHHARTGGIWGGVKPGLHDKNDPHDHKDQMDMHIWLSPKNAQAVVRHAAKTLSRHDPAHAPRYHENAKGVLARLQSLHQELTKTLLPVGHVPYVS